MVYKNQNYMTNKKIKAAVDENVATYNEAKESLTFTPITYYFKSYNDINKTTTWGTGTVETTPVEEDGYTQVEVKTNTPESSFVGQKFYIISSAATGTVYELFTDAGKTSANIFVEISKTEFTETPEEQEPFVPVTYYFKSYDDANKTTTWGTGTVETTDTVNNGYTQVEVKTNSPDDSFVGQNFYIISNATPGNVYELFTDAGETSANIFVEISETEFAKE